MKIIAIVLLFVSLCGMFFVVSRPILRSTVGCTFLYSSPTGLPSCNGTPSCPGQLSKLLTLLPNSSICGVRLEVGRYSISGIHLFSGNFHLEGDDT
jgi:hypothetical protein